MTGAGLSHGFSLFFVEYLFPKGNMQLGLKTFLPVSQIGLFWGAEGSIVSVFIFHPPFIPTSLFFVFFIFPGFGRGMSSGIINL